MVRVLERLAQRVPAGSLTSPQSVARLHVGGGQERPGSLPGVAVLRQGFRCKLPVAVLGARLPAQCRVHACQVVDLLGLTLNAIGQAGPSACNPRLPTPCAAATAGMALACNAA